MNDDEVLTLAEAAKLLRVDRKTLAKAATLGKVPGAKYGAQWRFRRSEIMRRLDGENRA